VVESSALLKRHTQKGIEGSNPSLTVSLVTLTAWTHCITGLHYKSTDFSDVQRCMTKSVSALRIAFPLLILTSAYAVVEAHRRKSLLFLGGRWWQPLPHASAGT
jgi:hypothetical protein